MINRFQTKLLLILLVILSTGIITTIQNTVSAQYYSYEDQDESKRRKRFQLSEQLIRKSISVKKTYNIKKVPQKTAYIYYFESKYDLFLYFEYPEYLDDQYFPYSSKIDPSYIDMYENFYIVYYDKEFRILREDYYENKKPFYYAFFEYQLDFKKREHVIYANEKGTVFDYLYYKTEDVLVTIEYSENEIKNISVKYRNEKDQTVINENYNADLEKDGIWYYYNKKIIKRKEEYWKKDELIKYKIYINDTEREYYDADSNMITKEIFDTI